MNNNTNHKRGRSMKSGVTLLRPVCKKYNYQVSSNSDVRKSRECTVPHNNDWCTFSALSVVCARAGKYRKRENFIRCALSE